eukprot:gene19560-26242_t
MVQAGFGQRPVIYPVLLAFFPIAFVIHNLEFAGQILDMICPTLELKATMITELCLLVLIGMLLPFVSTERAFPGYALIAMLICLIGVMTASFVMHRMGKMQGNVAKCQAMFDFDAKMRKKSEETRIKKTFAS